MRSPGSRANAGQCLNNDSRRKSGKVPLPCSVAGGRVTADAGKSIPIDGASVHARSRSGSTAQGNGQAAPPGMGSPPELGGGRGGFRGQMVKSGLADFQIFAIS